MKTENINFKISIVFLFLLFTINEFTWIIFLDADMHLKIVSRLFFVVVDIVLVISSVYFFLNRKNNNTFYRYLKILGFNIFSISIVFFILEIIFGDWYINNPMLFKLDDLILKRNVQYVYKTNGLYDNNGKQIKYVRDYYGLRGKYDKLENINIITMGGSTTDQRYINEGSTWQDIINQRLNEEGKTVYVVNAGIDGQSSYGHIKAIDNWLSNIKNLKPQYYLFYLGVNDVWKDTLDNYDRDIFIRKEDNINKTFYDKSALIKLKYIINSSFDYRVREMMGHGKISNVDSKWTKVGKKKNIKNLLVRYLDHYKARISILNELVIKNGSKAIFVTNTSALFKKDNHGQLIGRDINMRFKNYTINGIDMYYIYDSFHRTLEKYCKENQTIFIDLADELEFDYDIDFYDSVHNTPSGTKKIGDYLYEKLKSYF